MGASTAATYNSTAKTLAITLAESTTLRAGNYTVTVTDTASTPVSVTYTFNVAA